MTAIDSHADHEHPPFLAHHWETPEQQFEAGKLGMWLFLATEVLLFSGLFCAYSVIRHSHPEIFRYGAQFLDTRWGAINTVVLILSSVTMASGVWAAQTNRQLLLKICLLLTFAGAATFMGIKYIEYSHKIHENLVWGERFYEPPHHEGAEGEHAATGSAAAGAAHEAAPAESQGDGTAEDAMAAQPAVDQLTVESDGSVLTPRTAAPPVGSAPGGLVNKDVGSADEVKPEHHGHLHTGGHADDGTLRAFDPGRPANAHLFFGVYFCMTGLHGIHVLLGMGVISWLFYRSCRGDFGPEYFTPVDLGGLYWHVVDLIWIFLFPLLYLI